MVDLMGPGTAVRDTAGPVRVALADDNPIVRMGLVALLANDPGIDVCGEATDGRAMLDLVARERPAVALLDVRMPGADGLSVLPELVRLTNVLMLTHSDEPEVIARALRSGAVGYLVHGAFDSDELIRTVHDAAAGRMRLSPVAAAILAQGITATAPEPAAPAPAATPADTWARLSARHHLSPREVEVCRELVTGASNNEIARALFIEPKTVKNHLNSIFAKLGVSSRSHAIALLLGTAGDH